MAACWRWWHGWGHSRTVSGKALGGRSAGHRWNPLFAAGLGCVRLQRDSVVSGRDGHDVVVLRELLADGLGRLLGFTLGFAGLHQRGRGFLEEGHHVGNSNSDEDADHHANEDRKRFHD